MPEILQGFLAWPLHLEVPVSERDRGQRFPWCVAKLPPDGQRLLKVTERLPVPQSRERITKPVEDPRFTEPIAAPAHAFQGHAMRYHAVGPVVPPVKHVEEG